MGWHQFVVLYEDSDGLVRLQEVLKLSSQSKGLKIILRQLSSSQGNFLYFSDIYC